MDVHFGSWALTLSMNMNLKKRQNLMIWIADKKFLKHYFDYDYEKVLIPLCLWACTFQKNWSYHKNEEDVYIVWRC